MVSTEPLSTRPRGAKLKTLAAGSHWHFNSIQHREPWRLRLAGGLKAGDGAKSR